MSSRSEVVGAVPGRTVSTPHTLAAGSALPCSLTVVFYLGVCLEFRKCFACAPTSGNRIWKHYFVPGVFYFRCGSTTRAGMPLALS